MPFYTDLNLSMKRHPGTKDVLMTYDVEAAKNALRNIFFYSKFEKPFDPYFGMDVRSMLFEDFSVVTTPVINRILRDQLSQYEPRIVIDNLLVTPTPDALELTVEIDFHVVGFKDIHTTRFTVERTR